MEDLYGGTIWPCLSQSVINVVSACLQQACRGAILNEERPTTFCTSNLSSASIITSIMEVFAYPPRHPEINGYKEGDLIYAGDHLTLTCSSTGGKPPAELQWLRNGDMIQGSYSAHPTLTPIPLVTAVKLSVKFPPSSVTIEGPSECNRGDSITLNCRSDVSNPPSELTWLVDDVTFEPQDTTIHVVENGWYTTSNLTAIINRQFQNKSIKVFKCIGHNSQRHEKVFQTFNVSVLYPPETPLITGYEEGSELREGDHQSFTCTALAGNPPADLRWYRGETEVQILTGQHLAT
ncbi:synaptogenesis protein syg-2 [Caerostris extrusa]|uniref:Synaptogenesis protein syg-2 n=1 Tax=Caerostris extrusa TaxID=172846 RepID=A0AAV4VVU2_CAEEX|nr:synaptogenesis protein syg-2 [Caerostris extrusa]